LHESLHDGGPFNRLIVQTETPGDWGSDDNAVGNSLQQGADGDNTADCPRSTEDESDDDYGEPMELDPDLEMGDCNHPVQSRLTDSSGLIRNPITLPPVGTGYLGVAICCQAQESIASHNKNRLPSILRSVTRSHSSVDYVSSVRKLESGAISVEARVNEALELLSCLDSQHLVDDSKALATASVKLYQQEFIYPDAPNTDVSMKNLRIAASSGSGSSSSLVRLDSSKTVARKPAFPVFAPQMVLKESL
jgi:hypothetical protein